MFKSSGMIKVQVANDDGFHIFDVVPSGFDSIREFVVLRVFYSREYIRDWCWPFLYFVSSYITNIAIQSEPTTSRSSAQPVS